MIMAMVQCACTLGMGEGWNGPGTSGYLSILLCNVRKKST